jgi:hypothetical protein
MKNEKIETDKRKMKKEERNVRKIIFRKSC